MSVQQLDFYFPFVVVFYGAIMTFVLGNRFLMEIARRRLPFEYYQRFRLQKGFGWVCLMVGSLWSLQNLWLG